MLKKKSSMIKNKRKNDAFLKTMSLSRKHVNTKTGVWDKQKDADNNNTQWN